MSRICPLFSGSTGNSTYIATPSGSFLVDVGVSYRALCAALDGVGGGIDEISAIFITHSHTDHIKGLKVLLKNNKIPVYSSEKTADALIAAGIFGAGDDVRTFEISAEVCGTEITRFNTMHDCPGSGGYCFSAADGRKISVCTDLGKVTAEVRQALSGSDAVLIESNHDVEMLKNGPYPPELKVRVMSDNGHISNNACASELPRLLNNGTKRFILGHISLNNNTPLLALSAARAVLTDAGAAENRDYTLSAAKPKDNGVTVV